MGMSGRLVGEIAIKVLDGLFVEILWRVRTRIPGYPPLAPAAPLLDSLPEYL